MPSPLSKNKLKKDDANNKKMGTLLRTGQTDDSNKK